MEFPRGKKSNNPGLKQTFWEPTQHGHKFPCNKTPRHLRDPRSKGSSLPDQGTRRRTPPHHCSAPPSSAARGCRVMHGTHVRFWAPHFKKKKRRKDQASLPHDSNTQIHMIPNSHLPCVHPIGCVNCWTVVGPHFFLGIPEFGSVKRCLGGGCGFFWTLISNAQWCDTYLHMAHYWGTAH